MRSWLAVITFSALAFVTGCGLYFGDDVGDDDVCNGYGGIAAQYLDPNTGTCIGGGYDCEGSCPCAYPATEGAAEPNYASCYSQCTGLSEGTCLATSGCYAAYQDDPAADGKRAFTDCRATAPSGPQEGSCQGLNAVQCSAHDDCSLIYVGTTFETCQQETGGVCLGSDCAPGYHCEEQCTMPYDGTTMSGCQPACVPDGNTCAAVDCGPGYTCVQTCEDSANGGSLFCDATCVPNNHDPGSCTGFVACDASPPACPNGTTPGVLNSCWSGYCIPNSACGPNDPGECYAGVTCSTPSPACPNGTTPGVANGCYTGYCIPTSSCPPAMCESITSESDCTSRSDCSAVYTGTNCTCDAWGCSCQNLVFQRCETVGMF